VGTEMHPVGTGGAAPGQQQQQQQEGQEGTQQALEHDSEVNEDRVREGGSQDAEKDQGREEEDGWGEFMSNTKGDAG
jgi:hypothetical protein